MTAKNLIAFIDETEIEVSVVDNEEVNDDVLLFVDFILLDRFKSRLSWGDLDEGGLKAIMKDGYFCFWSSDLLELCEEDLNEVRMFVEEQLSL